MENNMTRIAHGVLDLETLGDTSNAPIVQVGVSLPSEDGSIGKYVFNGKVHYPQGYEPFEPTQETIDWWETQTGLVKDMVFLKMLDNVPSQSIAKVLQSLNVFLVEYQLDHKVDGIELWSHATFDPPILINAYKKTDIRLLKSFRHAIPFRNFRNFRTTDWLLGPDRKKFVYNATDNETSDLNLVHHYAPHDAIYEHYVLRNTFALLKSMTKSSYSTHHLTLFQEIPD